MLDEMVILFCSITILVSIIYFGIQIYTVSIGRSLEFKIREYWLIVNASRLSGCPYFVVVGFEVP